MGGDTSWRSAREVNWGCGAGCSMTEIPSSRSSGSTGEREQGGSRVLGARWVRERGGEGAATKGGGRLEVVGIWTGCMGACTLGGNVRRCQVMHLERRTAGRGACEGERLVGSLCATCEARRGRHWERGGLGYWSTRRCIVAQIAPSARTWHRSEIRRRLKGGEREELLLSRIRCI